MCGKQALEKDFPSLCTGEQTTSRVTLKSSHAVDDGFDGVTESIESIIEMSKLKEEGKLKALVVTGCLAQRYKEEIQEEIPEVDAVIGTTAYDEIVKVVDSILERAILSEL